MATDAPFEVSLGVIRPPFLSLFVDDVIWTLLDTLDPHLMVLVWIIDILVILGLTVALPGFVCLSCCLMRCCHSDARPRHRGGRPPSPSAPGGARSLGSEVEDHAKYVEARGVWAELGRVSDSDATKNDIALVRMSWVLEHAHSANPQMMRRQDIERLHPSAFISAQELKAQYDAFRARPRSWLRGGGVERRLPVVALSHCWLTRDHPDPYGHTLKALARVLESQRQLFARFGVTEMGVFIESPRRGSNPRIAAVPAVHDAAPTLASLPCAPAAHHSPARALVRTADSYSSMHQKDAHGARTPDEKDSFGRALQNMTIFYAHKLATVYMMTRDPYEHGYPRGYDAEHPGCSQHVKLYAERGWTSFERANAELIKPADHGNAWPQVIDIGNPPTAFSRFVPSGRWLCGLVPAPRWWLRGFAGSRVEQLYLSAERDKQAESAAWLLTLLESAPSLSQRLCRAVATFVNRVLPGQYMLSRRVAPASPRAFYSGGRYSTEMGVTFTNGSDVDVVAGLFERTTKAIYSGVRRLDYAGMGWTDTDLDQLLNGVFAYSDGEVPAGTLLARLQVLNLASNRFSAKGAAKLARQIDAGVLPSLEALHFAMNDVVHPKALLEACDRRGIATNWEGNLLWRLLYRVGRAVAAIILCWLGFIFLLVANDDHDPHGLLPSGTTTTINLIILAFLLAWSLWFGMVFGFFRAEGPRKAHYGRVLTLAFFPLALGVLVVMLYVFRETIDWVAHIAVDALIMPPPPPPPPGMWAPAPPAPPRSPPLPIPDAGGWMVVYYLLFFGPIAGFVWPFLSMLWNLLVRRPQPFRGANGPSTRHVVPTHASSHAEL